MSFNNSLTCKSAHTNFVSRDHQLIEQHQYNSSNTSDRCVFDLCKRWIRQCVGHHDICNQLESSESLPGRLIDLCPPDLPEEYWRLIQPSIGEHKIIYATVSHRWGPDEFKLSGVNEESFTAGMPVASLPGKFRDCVQVAKYLGIRYLWVDSICELAMFVRDLMLT